MHGRTVFLGMVVGALLLAVPPGHAVPRDLGTSATSNGSEMFGVGGVDSRRTARDTAGNPITGSGYPSVPSQDEIYEGSLSAAQRNRYDPDSWVTEILRSSNARQQEGQPFRPSVNHVVGTQVHNTSRVASSLVFNSDQRGGAAGGGSSWTDLARVLTQIFNGWDA